ncbi:hypothetical protein [Pararhizobium sp.]|uniref:hypothetical protein n=1 Tax=Pararhizobium sp. TaxID=1977563 RepID=UPI00271B66F9|nr:hypothetical protein [Pararhizobium sp.]MDO9416338.1 hypothetical protein [Pararhizobium sp.]
MTRRSFSKPRTGYPDTEIDDYFAEEPDRVDTEEALPEAGAEPDEVDLSRMHEEVRRLRAYVAHLTEEVNARPTSAAQVSDPRDRPASLSKAVFVLIGMVLVRRLKRAIFG